MIDYYVPKAGAASVNLSTSTKEFLDSLAQGDKNLKADRPQAVKLAGKDAMRTRLTTKTSLQQEPDQVVYLYTVPRQAGLWYLVLATQPSQLNTFDPIAKQMADSVQFPD